jgi:hypothetical protein
MKIIKGKYIVSVEVKRGAVVSEDLITRWVNEKDKNHVKTSKLDAFEKGLGGYWVDDKFYIRTSIKITTVNGKSEDYFCDKIEDDGFEIENIARAIMSCHYIEIKNQEIVHLQMLVK